MRSFFILTFFSFFVASGYSQKDSLIDKPQVKIGGALRFNYNLSTWKKDQVKRGGDFGYDVFRINSKAEYKGIKLDAEFRFYSQAFGGMILKQGWFGYDFDKKNNLQLGLTQVCFGNTQYNSHSWFFSLNYYVGLEDDHDMGIKFTHKDDSWEYAIAFFKNAEEYSFGNNSDVSDSRYAYDVASIDLDGDGVLELRNKEVNQLNGQLNRLFKTGLFSHRLGVSGQFGGLYNLDTKKMGNHYAWDVHYLLKWKRFDFKCQFSHYAYDSRNLDGERTDVVAMTAYGAPYLVSAEGMLYSAGVSYQVPVDFGPVSSLEFYNDFGYLDKRNESFSNTLMNVTGVLVTAGHLYTYVDFASGKNQPWLGPGWTYALADGDPEEEWNMRFNINFGYYF